MRVVLKSSLGLAVLLASTAMHAQQLKHAPQGVRPSEKTTIRPAIVSWNELREIQKSMPAMPPSGIPFIGQEPATTIELPPIELTLKADHAQPSAPSTGIEKILPCAGFASEPPIGAGFDSQLDVPDSNGFSFIPPDVAGAVGPNHLMTMLAPKVLIQDRLGGTVTSVDTSTFWSPLGTTPLAPTTTYQRVMFDALEGRWIATAREGTLGALNTRIFFAITQTDDPTGVWDFYSITADPAGVPTSGADWVVTGYNTDWITICANMFNSTGASFLGTKMWTIDVNTALVPGGPITVYTFATGWTTTVHGSGGNSVMPAQTLDSDPTLWMINTAFTSSNIQLFQISAITNSGGTPVVSAIAGSPFGGTTSFCFTTTSWSSTQRTMAQVGEARFIAPFSVRQASVVTRNGKIWAANSGGLPGPANNAAPTSNGVIWRQIDPTLPFPGSPGAPGTMVLQDGAITNGVNTMNMFPSIAVNCADDMLIGYSNGDATISPRACYSIHLGSGPLGSIGAVNELKAGESTYWKNFGVGTTATWGRYTSAAVDPNDNRTLWTLQQYADTRVGVADNDSRWGTWWGRFGDCEQLPAPSILDQPDPVSGCVGDPASFTVVANAGPTFQYQWRLDGVDIPGATSSTYSIGATAPADAGTYDVVVSGCGIEISDPATLSFGGAIVTVQPVDTNAPIGGTGVFFVAGTGAGTLTYQWYFNGNPISGETADTLTISPVSGPDYGSYSCVITDACGPASSDPAILNPEIKGGKTQPAELSLHIFTDPQSTIGCVGGTATFTVAAYPAGVTYLWRKNGIPIVPPETGPSLVINPVTLSDGGNYSVKVSLGAQSVTSGSAGLTLSDVPLINVQPSPGSQSVGPGSDVTYTVTATGLYLKYQWKKKPNVPFAPFSDMPGMTGATLFLQSVSVDDGGTYRCVVSNDCGQVQTIQLRLLIL